jgi:hypothetical protein
MLCMFQHNWLTVYPQTAFTSPPNLSGRFTHAAIFQYYDYVSSLNPLIYSIQKAACGETNYDCALQVSDLIYADSIDIDYDSISNAFTVGAFWSKSRLDDKKWWETHLRPRHGDSVEIGALTNETPEEAEDLRYSGFLTKIGENTEPCTSTQYSCYSNKT